ncbi:MAG: arginine--tRNA ligase [Clostridiales bacterium]|nr:arginine--tRNA ligase [Clostridiales bacterium]
MDYREEIARIISEAAEIEASEVMAAIGIPDDMAHGNFDFPCHRLAKTMRKPPAAIAEDLKSRIVLTQAFEEVKAEGPYLNFFINKAEYAESVLSMILGKGARYGESDDGSGKTVVIDYSSPNVTHEFHIGHLFSAVIGAAIYRIYDFLGYKTVGINYIGDWGTQFGKLLYAYSAWSSREKLEAGGLDELTRVYVKYHEEESNNPELKESARAWLVRLENGDAEAVELWKWFCKICLDKMEIIYKRLGITFDSYRGESYYEDKMQAVVDELFAKNLMEESEGAQIVNLEAYKMPPCLILRSDGGTLYPTRDIASAFDRKRTYDFYKSLYVTDMRQNLHFAQFFKVLELMGYDWAKDMRHIPYGVLSLENGPLQSRKGNTILLKDVFDEAARLILEVINEKNAELENKESVAEDVGVGAVVFGVLYTSRIKDLVFSWEKALNFDGETGPYVQYTHARATSVLSKGGLIIDGGMEVNFSKLTDPAAQELIKALDIYPSKIKEAAEKYEPFILARALVAIAQGYNKFYNVNIILTSDEDIKRARLALTKCVKDTLKSGLGLLGIKAPEKM